MINIDKFKTFIDAISNKNGRGTTTPTQFNSIIERALFAWTNGQISNDKQYAPGNPIPQTSMDLDSLSQARLRHLKKMVNIRVVNGVAELPNGANTDLNGEVMQEMWIVSKLSHKYANNGTTILKGIKIIKDLDWDERISSDIVMPTKKRAIASMQSDSLLIEPKALINLVNLSYYRNPNTPKWAYDMTTGRPVYDEINSVNLDAPKSAFNSVAMMALEFMGIKIREAELVQAANSLNNKGV
jgi:hypothetical protein